MSIEISDDPSFVPSLLEELKRNFATQTTKDIGFRKQALKNLVRGHEEMQA
jgi:hypothetical protein